MKNPNLTYVLLLFLNLFFLYPDLNAQYFRMFGGPILAKNQITRLDPPLGPESTLGSGFIAGFNVGFPLKKFRLSSSDDVKAIVNGIDMGFSFNYKRTSVKFDSPDFPKIKLKESQFEARAGLVSKFGRLMVGAGGQIDFKTQFEVDTGWTVATRDEIVYSTYGEIGVLLGTNKKGKPGNWYISFEYIRRIDPNNLIISALGNGSYEIEIFGDLRLVVGVRFGK